MLNDCVHAYMAELGELKHEDVMRAFFRTRVAELGRLIRKVVEVIRMSAEQTKRDVYQLLPEANQIVIVSHSRTVPSPWPTNLGYLLYPITGHPSRSPRVP